MDIDIFDITSAFIFYIFGKTFLQQPKIQTAYIRLLLVCLSLFIEFCSLAVSFQGAILDDDECKAMFSLIIITFIIMCASCFYWGIEVFESTEDTLTARKITFWTKSIGCVSAILLFAYSCHLYEKYNADIILLVFTSVDFGLDVLEIIIFIIILYLNYRADQTQLDNKVNPS